MRRALKRAAASRPSGEWNDDDFDVLADGVVVGRIFKANASPVGVPWMWTLAFGYEATRTCPKPDTLWGSPQGDVELMTQKKVLDFKPQAKLLARRQRPFPLRRLLQQNLPKATKLRRS
jgi:hypothetical protein